MRCRESDGILAVRIFLQQLVEGVKGLLRVDRRTLRQIDVEPALHEIRLTLEIHQSLHVVGVVDARVGRVFANEGIGGVDRRIDVVILVVGVDQIDLRLARRFAEREARLQGFELFDRLPVARILHRLLGAGVDHFRAGFGIVPMTAAARSQHADTDGEQQNAARMDKITQSHKRILTMGGFKDARQYTRCPAASFECPYERRVPSHRP